MAAAVQYTAEQTQFREGEQEGGLDGLGEARPPLW